MPHARQCGWVARDALNGYDCRYLADAETSRFWRMACVGPAQRYQPQNPKARARALSFVPCDQDGEGPSKWNASRVLQLLSNRTVVMVGDSMIINLFCALSCAMLHSGEAVIAPSPLVPGEKRSHALVETGPLPELRTWRIRSVRGDVVSKWVLPSCAGGKQGRCFYNHQGASGGCGLATLDRLGGVSSRQALVVIHNPCGAHYNRPLLRHLAASTANATLGDFRSWRTLVPEGAMEARESSPYAAACQAAATKLAAIQNVRGERSLAIMLESPPAHNPVLPGCVHDALVGTPSALSDLVDENDWEGYVLGLLGCVPAPPPPLRPPLSSPLTHSRTHAHTHIRTHAHTHTRTHAHTHTCTHTHKQPDGAAAALTPVISRSRSPRLLAPLGALKLSFRLHRRYARRLLQMAGGERVLQRLHILSPSLLVRGSAHLARLLAFARLAAACDAERMWNQSSQLPSCVGRVHSAEALACALRRMPMLKAPTMKAGDWKKGFHPGGCAERVASYQGELSAWRQHAEREAAAALSVPLLERLDARKPRWDAHPGVQAMPPNFLDCKHSTFAPGVFDVEAVGFLRALERRFGSHPLGFAPAPSRAG